MDEKRFDDGTYNARYEVVKNVLTKNIKGTTERITEKRKLPLCSPTIKKQNT
jgi:hypothetical protein